MTGIHFIKEANVVRIENRLKKLACFIMVALSFFSLVFFSTEVIAAADLNQNAEKDEIPFTTDPTNHHAGSEQLSSSELDDGQIIYKTYQFETLSYAPAPAPCDADCDSNFQPHYKPEPAPLPGDPTQPLTSSLAPVNNPTMWPYSPTVRLLSLWPSGDTTLCSGMLVGAKHMLTAASCVFTHSSALCAAGQEACWVEDLEITPAYHQELAPLGKTGFQTIQTWTNWTIQENYDYDIAAIELDSPLGAYIGWLGYGYDTQLTMDLSFDSTSYPGDAPFGGEQMFGQNVELAALDEHCLIRSGEDVPGQIGAAIYTKGSDYIIYGVLSRSSEQGIIYTRLTYEKYDAIRTFIDEGLPKNDFDLFIFNVNAVPARARPGQTLTYLNFYLYNHASESAEIDNEILTVYLSADPVFTEDDQILTSFPMTLTFEAGQGERIIVPLPIELPGEIHGPGPLGGIYYLGVALPSGFVDAKQENNQSSGLQAQPIWIYDSDNLHFNFPVFRH